MAEAKRLARATARTSWAGTRTLQCLGNGSFEVATKCEMRLLALAPTSCASLRVAPQSLQT
eukprot:9061151-Alexandrium_andersonii.AAC.1